jgi:hypothetical protein
VPIPMADFMWPSSPSPGFCHTQVKRVIPSHTVLLGSQQMVWLNHNKRVASLH